MSLCRLSKISSVHLTKHANIYKSINTLNHKCLPKLLSTKTDSIDKEINQVEKWNKLYMLRELSTQRTHRMQDLIKVPIGTNVVLCGWIERIRKLSDGLIFLIIKDGTGSQQCVIKSPLSEELKQSVQQLGLETLIRVQGNLISRPNQQNSNDLMELDIQSLDVLSQPNKLPFVPSHTKQLPNEEVRLRHRCLDLRRDLMQNNLRIRSKLNHLLRCYLIEQGFVEVETPILFKATPEGAKEFLVPSRTPGHYYSLPQSPQQYKQLLMVSGIDRYFQIAKCFRDEDLRADRQPEFTQLDIELTYCNTQTIIQLIEGLVKSIWKTILNKDLSIDFPHVSYNNAMEEYGSDKPDLRYPYKILNITDQLSATSQVRALRLPELASHLSSNQIKSFGEQAKLVDTTAKLRLIKITEQNIANWLKLDGIVNTSNQPNPHLDCSKLNQSLNIQVGDVVAIEVKPHNYQHNGGWTSLGRLRIDYIQHSISQGWIERSTQDKFLWIVDFPLFELEDGVYKSTHHPFTSPKAEDLKYLLNEPQRVRGDHYDLVLNGQEIGGGSLRIHEAELQKFVLTHHLKLSPHQLNQFHHLLTNLDYACPPHGGIALGLDRLMSILCDSNSLRDVIAFPKTNLGQDLMVGSPSTLE